MAVVSPSTNHCSETPVSSDDGFCGSSDISDPSIPGGHHHHLLTSYRQPYLMMKDNLLSKNSLTDTGRRVRFNLISEQQEPIFSSNQSLRQVEQMYMSEKQSMNSTIV